MLRSNLGPFPAANKKSVSRHQEACTTNNDDFLVLARSHKYILFPTYLQGYNSVPDRRNYAGGRALSSKKCGAQKMTQNQRATHSRVAMLVALTKLPGRGTASKNGPKKGGGKKGLPLVPVYRACSLANRDRRAEAEGDLNCAFRHSLHSKSRNMYC